LEKWYISATLLFVQNCLFGTGGQKRLRPTRRKRVENMVRYTTAFLLFLLFAAMANAQNLDRISMSSGGAAGDNVNYVLGETFNFTMATGGSNGISLESGSLSSEENTGGDIPTILQEASEMPSQIECYPNPVSDILTIDFNCTEGVTSVAVFNALGQMVLQAPANSEKAYLNVKALPTGSYFVSVMNGKDVIAVKMVVKNN